ncbi:MAG: hypothetical protein CSA76_02390 [Spirochaetales bacterium]|nr:MAG: hypothetical protein CSA76_02390 [Spirochaetales bacterium]
MEKAEGNCGIDEQLAQVYVLFEEGCFDKARALLDKAHAQDFENPEVLSALRACGYWQQRAAELQSMENNAAAQGDYLQRQWNRFEQSYRQGFEHPLKEGSSRLKLWVHTRALEYYTQYAEESSDPRIMLQSGRCLKKLGRFEESIQALERVLRETGQNNAALLAELADCYSLIGETKAAKVLMREALFVDAPAVETDELASPLFNRLVERLGKVKDRSDAAFIYWLPVYGTLWGVLDVKRELSPLEYGKLKQAIYALKSEIADGDKQGLLTPQLINSYFWLVDHYQLKGADRSTVEEALLNIKLLSPSIYRQYFE